MYESCNILGIWDIEQANDRNAYHILHMEEACIINTNILINAIYNVTLKKKQKKSLVWTRLKRDVAEQIRHNYCDETRSGFTSRTWNDPLSDQRGIDLRFLIGFLYLLDYNG